MQLGPATRSRCNDRGVMEKGDWRFDVMMTIRLSFREGWTLQMLKERIIEIEKKHEEDREEECIGKSSQCSEES